jgi:hypothetical protein
MSSEKYIGLDVHQATISVAVMDSKGKIVMESILETKAATILEFFAGLRGTLMANYAILSQPDNAELGDRDPFDVWIGMKSNQRECAGKQLCFIASENLLCREAYDEFVEFRAAKVAEQLNAFIGLGAARSAAASI